MTKLYKWIYKYKEAAERSGPYDLFEVIPDVDMPKPLTLFKYYGLDDRSIENLNRNRIYATHPDQFNDIFDCSNELIEFDNDDFLYSFLSESVDPNTLRDKYYSDRDGLERFVNGHFKEVLYRKMGILCLTEKCDNNLMWSYYSNHKGFAVEYDYEKFPFDFLGPFPVNYQSNVEPVKLSEVGLQVALLFQSNIKQKIWEHEREWRILIASNNGDMVSPDNPFLEELGGKNRLFSYNINAIRSITLGSRFFNLQEVEELEGNRFLIKLKDIAQEGEDRFKTENRRKLLDFIIENKIDAAIILPVNKAFEIRTQQILIERSGLSYTFSFC